MNSRVAAIIAASAGLLAVALGAFAAHALREVLSATQLNTWRTAVDYQFWHALALFGVSIWMRQAAATGGINTKSLSIAASALVVGIALFCGSLYALALGAPRWIGAITPLGGIAFIIGWLSMLVAAWCDR